MIKNYFILNRIALELNDLLKGSILIEFFSQDKDRAILEFEKNDETKFVEISVNPVLPFISIRNDFRRAKKNTVDFFEALIASEVESVSICNTDRIIKFKLSKGEFYFTIRGKHTNIISITFDNQINSFKKEDKEFINRFKMEVAEYIFISDFNIPDFSLCSKSISDSELKKIFPFIGKEIFIENKFRSEKEFDLVALEKLIKEMSVDSFAVLVDESKASIKLSFKSFKQFTATKTYLFNSVLEALNYYLPLKFRMESKQSDEKILKKHLDFLSQRISQKLNRLKTVLDRESREEEHNKAANLLLINIHLIKQGMKEIELQDIYRNNENVSIKLDPAKSPRKNVDNYFEKSRSEKLNRAKSLTLYEKSKKEFEATQKKVTEIEKGISPQRLKEMMDELKIKTQNQSDDREDIRSKFKRYVIDNKYFVFVGRDSKNNDLLTTKFAKQNDYWFHARSLPGSHVVLKVDNSIDNVPKDVLKRTASLAAYHSKAKTAGMVPVSYTQKKYVVKKKGMEAGKVALLKEEVLIVKPGIPAGCEFIESD